MMKRKTKEAIAGWIYILPSFLTLLIFIAIPIVESFYFSLTDYSVLSAPVFCGLKNYLTAFQDEFVQASLKNTVVYVLVTVPFQTADTELKRKITDVTSGIVAQKTDAVQEYYNELVNTSNPHVELIQSTQHNCYAYVTHSGTVFSVSIQPLFWRFEQ